MSDLVFVFIGGLLGSAHCVGMCGGFAMLVGAQAHSIAENFLRQIFYSLGRIFTYSAIGSGVGYAGLRLTDDMPSFVHAQALLAMAAGALLIVQGLTSARVLSWSKLRDRLVPQPSVQGGLTILSAPSNSTCPAVLPLGQFLRAPGWWPPFLAGMLTGFLPCGLVYGYLALAASTADMGQGLATMAAFGLGTVPLMVLAGSGSSLISLASRRRLYQWAAWCVVLTGLLSITRGLLFLNIGPASSESCPMCP